MKRVLAGLAGLGGAGAVWQRVSSRRDLDRHPPAGRLVDIGGGTRLHLVEQGSGSPAVVLDGGLGTAVSWESTARLLAPDVRVVTYDRAGIGYSDPAPTPRTTAVMTDELWRLLDRGGVQGPYVIVGASGAANTARMFAIKHPASTVGVVLVDPVNDTPASVDSAALSPATRFQIQVMEGTAPPVISPVMSFVAGLAALGLIRAAMALNALPSAFAGPIDTIPEDARPVFRIQNASPGAWRVRGSELAKLPESFRELRAAQAAHGFPDVPLVVISAGFPGFAPPGALEGDALRSMREWRERSSRQLASTAPRGAHVWAEKSNHGVIFHEPGLIASCVRNIVEASRVG